MDILGAVVGAMLAVGLGVALAFSFAEQLRLQQLELRKDNPSGSLHKRLTLAGLSMSILCVTVLTAKWAVLPYEAFILIAAAGAMVTLVIRKRSDRRAAPPL